MIRIVVGGAAASLLVLAGACVGDSPNGGENTTSSSSSGDPGSSSDASSGGSSGASSGSSGTSSGGSSGVACTQACKSDSVLLECTAEGRIERPCELGCSFVTSQCNSFEPLGDVAAADLAGREGELAIDTPAGEAPITVDTITGAIGGGVRAANGNPNTAETISGITFERRGGLAVFRARQWTFRNVLVDGDIPVAFVSTESIAVEGYVLAACGRLGGAPAAGSSPGNGGLPQTDSEFSAGGGGGGFGTIGGVGGSSEGDDVSLAGGPAGAAVLFLPNAPRGGGRGGGFGKVGLGGGVIFMVSGTSIQVGTGNTIAVAPPGKPRLPAAPMGLNVGGCGGDRGGQGGGAGGAIVLEAPRVAVQSNAGLAANGGGGGASGGETTGNTAGQDGILGASPAAGGYLGLGQDASIFARGGAGATGTTAAQPGGRPTGPEYTFGAGGGGGAGHIIVRTRDATIAQPGGAILSPAPVLETIDLL